MRILFYINTLARGGAQRVMINLANLLAEKNNQVIFVNSINSDDSYAINEKIKHIVTDKKAYKNPVARNITRISKLRRIIKKYKPDVAISFMPESNLRLIVATRLLKTKVIISERNNPDEEYKSFLWKFIAKKVFPMADGCVFQTKEVMNWFPLKLQAKSTVIYNIVDQSFYNTDNNGDKNVDIISIGRLVKQKNYDMLIDAIGLIINKYNNIKVDIYGTGDEFVNISNKIKKENLNHNICLKGLTDNVSNVLSKSKIFVLTSNYEGMPNALMEAMTVGLCCIATDSHGGGAKELMGEGGYKYLVKCGDKRMLANKLDQLLSAPQKIIEAQNYCKERSELFKPEVIFDAWNNYIGKIVKN